MPHSAKRAPDFLTIADVAKYGFEWPEFHGETLAEAPRVQVTRVASIDRGTKGVFRILNVRTKRRQVNVYISPSGLIRVFDGRGVEWKPPSTR